jgi:hypothetical protein
MFSSIPNLLTSLQLDVESGLGGASGLGAGAPSVMGSSISTSAPIYTTAASEVMRGHIGDILEFLSDVHTLTKVKTNVKTGSSSSSGRSGNAAIAGLNEDTLGGILKASLSQYLALEISKGNGGAKDNRTVNRYDWNSIVTLYLSLSLRLACT